MCPVRITNFSIRRMHSRELVNGDVDRGVDQTGSSEEVRPLRLGMLPEKPSPRKMEEALHEEYRWLALQINLDIKPAGQGRCLIMTSPGKREQGEEVIVGLAEVFSTEHGCKVLIVDARFDAGSMSKKLSIPPYPGLLNILNGPGPSFENAPLFRRTSKPGLFFLACGQTDKSLGKLLDPKQVRDVIDYLRNQFDFIMMKCGPILNSPEILCLAPIADTVLLMISEGVTRISDIVKAHEILKNAKSKQIMMVLASP